MEHTKNKYTVKYMVRLATLVAILLLMEVTGVGLIRIPLFPGLEFTIMQVPVIIGAIVMGPMAGGILGGIFGIISFWECFGKSAFGVVLMGVNPLYTFLVCVPTRLIMGAACGWIFLALTQLDRSKQKLFCFGAASLCGALLNTTLFMSALVLFFYQTEFIQGFVTALGVANPLTFIVTFVGFQGLIEAIICCVTGAAVSKALYKAMNR